MHRRQWHDAVRRGVAATELALILPLFVLLFVLAVDFSRVFYVRFIVINAARCGALYGSTGASQAADTATIEQKARAEADDLDPTLLAVVVASTADSASNPCIDVTCRYSFQMVTSYLVARELNVVARVRMPVAPVLPTFN
jgi:Flp pilus assembly protein TadG